MIERVIEQASRSLQSNVSVNALVAQLAEPDRPISAEEIEDVYSSGVLLLPHVSEFWPRIETHVLNKYFSEAGSRRLYLEARHNLDMLSWLIDGNVVVLGDLSLRHVGHSAVRSIIVVEGNVGHAGNSSTESHIEVLGDVGSSLASDALRASVSVVGNVKYVGSRARESRFSVKGDTGIFLKGAKYTAANVDGDVLNAALTGARECRVNIYGDLRSSVFYAGIRNEMYVFGGIEGEVYGGGVINEQPLRLPHYAGASPEI